MYASRYPGQSSEDRAILQAEQQKSQGILDIWSSPLGKPEKTRTCRSFVQSSWRTSRKAKHLQILGAILWEHQLKDKDLKMFCAVLPADQQKSQGFVDIRCSPLGKPVKRQGLEDALCSPPGGPVEKPRICRYQVQSSGKTSKMTRT